MTRKHAGFTDLRILGGSRQRGGGVDADLRIKLPPACTGRCCGVYAGPRGGNVRYARTRNPSEGGVTDTLCVL